MELVYNPHVTHYLDELPDKLRIEVYDALGYFEDFGTAAQLPDVAPIVTMPGTWETRTQMTIHEQRYTIRVLIRVHSPTLAFVTIAGDKDRWNPVKGNWYDHYGPISESVYDVLKEKHP